MLRGKGLLSGFLLAGATLSLAQPTPTGLHWVDTNGVAGTRDRNNAILVMGTKTVTAGTKERLEHNLLQLDTRIAEYASNGALLHSQIMGYGSEGAVMNRIKAFGGFRFAVGGGGREPNFIAYMWGWWDHVDHLDFGATSFGTQHGIFSDVHMDGGFVYALQTHTLGGTLVKYPFNYYFVSPSAQVFSNQRRPSRFVKSGNFVATIGTGTGPSGSDQIFRMDLGRDLSMAVPSNIDAPAGYSMVLNDVSQGSSGRVAFTATISNVSNPADVRGLIGSWSADGLQTWTKIVGDAGDATLVTKVFVGPDGSGSERVLAVGSRRVAGSLSSSPYAVSLTPEGQVQWEHGPVPGTDEKYQTAAIASDGKVFVGGYSRDAGGYKQVSMRELNRTNGDQLQELTWGSHAVGDDSIAAMAIDSNQDIHAVGQFRGGPANEDGLVMRYVRKPVAVNDVYTVVESARFEFDPTVNDLRFPDGVATLVSGPAHGGLVQRGRSFLYVPTPGYLGSDSITYEIRRGGLASTATASFQVVRGPINVTLGKSQMAGQNQTNGKVLLSGPAGPGGQAVSLSTDSPKLTCSPTTLIVPAGNSVGTFAIRSLQVEFDTVCVVSATCNGITQTRAITLIPIAPSAFAFTPSPVIGGNPCSVRLVINGVAGPDTWVLLHDSSEFCSTPATVQVPIGAPQVIFDVQTLPVTSPQSVGLTASIGGRTKTGFFTIVP